MVDDEDDIEVCGATDVEGEEVMTVVVIDEAFVVEVAVMSCVVMIVLDVEAIGAAVVVVAVVVVVVVVVLLVVGGAGVGSGQPILVTSVQIPTGATMKLK